MKNPNPPPKKQRKKPPPKKTVHRDAADFRQGSKHTEGRPTGRNMQGPTGR
jgi:hypothetical protein